MLRVNDLMEQAFRFAQDSPDPRTQNSAILINDSGNQILHAVNTFPDKIHHLPERWNDRDIKLKYVLHAEANVLHLAARNGIATHGLIMVSPWAACTECAKVIIQCGIKRLITQLDQSHPYWMHNTMEAHAMLAEAGVVLQLVECKFPHLPIRRNGGVWKG